MTLVLALILGLFMAQTTLQAATWTAENANAPASTSLRGIWGSDANNVWIAGGDGSALILKWNGSVWGSQTTPATARLYTVWGTSSTNVWVGGRNGHISRYNGSTWTTFTSGIEAGGTNGPYNINSIWGADANNIWAVADNGEFGPILKWNGTSWSTQYTHTSGLRALWGTSSSNIWAVGTNRSIVHYDGVSWSPVTYSVSPALNATTTLVSIWGSDANNIWVGGGVDIGQTLVTLLKWNGTSWSRADTTGLPVVTSFGTVRSITGTTANNVYAVGDQGAFMSRWDGSTWAAETTVGSSLLFAIWGTSDGVNLWASGSASSLMRGLATASSVAPTVTTPTSASVTESSATLGGDVTADGGASITERGVVYAMTATNANPEIGGTGVTKVTGTGTTGVFTVSATSLTANSAYSYKAYAQNTSGTSYSSVGTFSTLADMTAPTVVSVTRSAPSAQAISTSSVTFRVTYSEPVTGVAVGRFVVMPVDGSDIVGTVAGVTPVSTSVYDVAVSVTSGTGEFRLRVQD